MYSLSLSETHTFSIIASPDCTLWLERLVSLLMLKPGPANHAGRIMIAPLLPQEPVRSDAWNTFGNHHAKVAVNHRRKLMEIGIPGDAAERPENLSAAIKLLIVGISTLLLPDRCLLLHTATLVRNDQAVLIAAPSGGGKTTTTKRIPPSWSAPGDEYCLIVPDGSGGYDVHVLPTISRIAAGTGNMTWDITRPYPLRGICILKQADLDRIERYPSPMAAICLNDSFRQAIQNQVHLMTEEYRRRVRASAFEQTCSLVRKVPVYLLSTTLTGRFWELIDEEIFSVSARIL